MVFHIVVIGLRAEERSVSVAGARPLISERRLNHSYEEAEEPKTTCTVSKNPGERDGVK